MAPDATTRWLASMVPFKSAEGVTAPVVPILATILGAGASAIGVMEFLFQTMMMAGAFTWGHASDRFRLRKPFLVAGFALAGLGILGMGLAPNFATMLPSRMVMGFGMASIGAVGGALLADLSEARDLGSRIGLLNAVGGVGYTVGLVGGGLVVYWYTDLAPGWLFTGAGLLALVSIPMAVRLVREPDDIAEGDGTDLAYADEDTPTIEVTQDRTYSPFVFVHRPEELSMTRRAAAFLSSIFLVYLSMSAVMVLLPLYLLEVGGGSEAAVFLVFVVHSAVSAFSFTPAGRLADRIGYRTTQVSAMTLRMVAFAFLAMPLFATTGPIAGVFVVVGVSTAVIASTGPATLFKGMPFRERGELSGIFNVATGAGKATGSITAGLIVAFAGFPSLFLLATMMTGAGTMVTAYIAYPEGARF
jgi:MFS family permease